MKKYLLQLLVIAFISIGFISCGIDMFDKINGNKNVITQQRKINGDFDAIKISTGLELYLTQNSNINLTVKADENLHDIIITKVENGVLKIYSEKNIWRAKARKIYVAVPDLKEIKATSGSNVSSENTLKFNSLKISATSGAHTHLKVDSEHIETTATSGAEIQIEGKTTDHTSKATSGSSIKAYNLQSRNTIVKATSGANIKINASETLEAKATSGGDIYYKGSPKTVKNKETSGGNISAKNQKTY